MNKAKKKATQKTSAGWGRTRANKAVRKGRVGAKKEKRRAERRVSSTVIRENTGSLDYLLETVGVDGPSERAAAFAAGNKSWPVGWWAVSDENGGYIAYFEHESDAWSFRLVLINKRMNARSTVDRYRIAADSGGSPMWITGSGAKIKLPT